jgi:hypothetical protein
MRTTESLVTVILAALLAAPVLGSDPMPGVRGDLAVTFVSEDGTRDRGGDALLDLGPVSASWTRAARSARRSGPEAAVSRRVGVRISSRTGRHGFVRLRAFLATPAQRGSVSVDGVVLTTAPRIVDAQAPIGSTVGHVVKLQVPGSDPAGAFSADIVWEVEEP